MILETKQTILEKLPSRYERQYQTNSKLFDGRWSDDILKELKAESPLTEERVKSILKNSGWTDNTCDECGKDVLAVVQLGEAPDYESNTASICIDCIKKAFVLITISQLTPPIRNVKNI